LAFPRGPEESPVPVSERPDGASTERWEAITGPEPESGAADVVGLAENTRVDPNCPASQKFQFHRVVWRHGQIQLATVSDPDGVAILINDGGQMVAG
jgi:hypothetical protein